MKIWRRILWQCLLLALVAGGALVAAEWGFRLLCGYDIITNCPPQSLGDHVHGYSLDPELLYELRPNHAFRDGREKTNRFGMRGADDLTVPKPPGVYRVAVLGDSIAFGHHLERDEVLSSRLESRLNGAGARRVQVLNFAVTGYNADQERIVLRDKVLRFSPDFVLLVMCMNDVTPTDGLGKLTRARHSASPGPRLHSELLTYVHFLWALRVQSQRVDYGQLDRLFTSLQAVEKAGSVRVGVVIVPERYDAVSSYAYRERHQLFRDSARRCGLEVLDLLDTWLDLPAERRDRYYLPKDDVHLSAAGVEAAASAVVERWAL